MIFPDRPAILCSGEVQSTLREIGNATECHPLIKLKNCLKISNKKLLQIKIQIEIRFTFLPYEQAN